MDFELRRASEKLRKEQRERKEKARLRQEKERKAKEEAYKQREAVEAVLRSRRLDAIDCQLKADEKMQENLLAGRGICFLRILEAVPFQGNGDKIKLPPSCFTALSDEGAFDKGPLYFQLLVVHHEGPSEMTSSDSKQKKQKTTHSGVLEFTAEEGSVGLPPHVWNNLFSADAPKAPLVEVRYVWLPKGTYAKLQPDVVGFSDVPNHKAILETSLRQHATLSVGDMITVNHGILIYKLRVLELKPSTSISVLETDIEVDVVGSESAVESANQHNLKPLNFGAVESGMVEEGSYRYYKFSVDDDSWRRIASGEVRVEIKLEVETVSGDTDLYISKHPLIFPARHQHIWSSHDVGSKTLILSHTDENFGKGTYTIGVYGFQGTTKYKVSVCVQNISNLMVSRQAGSSSSLEVDSVECRNCKHLIPSKSIVLHEAYCTRHNIVCQHSGCGIVLRNEEARNHLHCEKCGQAFHQEEMQKHMEVFHEPLQCPCGIFLEKEQMVQHQASDCPLRLITCQFCGDTVAAGSSAMDLRDRLRGLSQHESICGSRTALCDSCGRSVMLKEMDIHYVAVHQKS
ncbi:hypothetical protein K2173_018505 [Erythroxylum novogranatense]|uniref:Uncharacterized protein n=1 Tax=Erythroxylum novogranatense TaxID=1862640 RepID=A0AAV8UFE1_9ROSI|nr:hypothetical protein K2173_018505 [Erythroxylum novogranatense]